MSYIADITQPLIQTLRHFATLPAHQLAGHAKNLEFWRSEVDHCKSVIDGYQSRFEKLREGQQVYGLQNNFGNETVDTFDGKMVVPITSMKPLKRNLPDSERKKLIRDLNDSLYAFEQRLYQENLIEYDPNGAVESTSGS